MPTEAYQVRRIDGSPEVAVSAQKTSIKDRELYVENFPPEPGTPIFELIDGFKEAIGATIDLKNYGATWKIKWEEL